MTSWAKFSRELLQLPNLLSLLRLFLGFIIPSLVLSRDPNIHILAAVLFTFGSLTDYWDGLAARKMGLVTGFGKIMDPLADKVLILGTMTAFAETGFYSYAWLVPIFAREIIITFCRFAWLHEGSAVGAEKLGKIKLCVQVAAVAFSFFYLFGGGTGRGFLWAAMIFFIAAACILTLVSGVTFLKSNAGHLKTPAFARFVSALGVGFLKPAPGTWGSLLALPFIWLIQIDPFVYAGTFLFIFAAGWAAVNRLGLEKQKDPSYVVVDEFCGMLIAFAGVPLSLFTAVMGFLLFRLFDIFKPPPLRQLERLPGFWGIMMDDLGAGFITWIILFYVF